jgi:hypothetical protein
MWRCLFFFLLLSLLPPGSCRNNCPVTSRYDVLKNGYLPLPSLYWPKKLLPEPGEEFYNCSIPIYKKPSIIGTCMPQRPCLVSPEIVHAALKPQKWIPSMNAICSLEEQIHDHKAHKDHSYPQYSLNLIIIGGSMTKGSETNGKCICSQSEDSRCSQIDRSKLGMSFCSWATQFVNWLTAEFPMIQFNVSDLSYGGMSSSLVPNIVDPSLRRLTLSDNDIIIIDESVNDALRPIMSDLQGEVESMIRRLFISAKGSYPTIIMIEQFPHGSRTQLKNIRHGNSSHHMLHAGAGEYEIIYRNLSNHYEFLLYSLRDVYWTFFNKTIPKSHRYRFSPYDIWHLHTHPPWYFHNFMADIIADCFLHSLGRCRDIRESRKSHTHHQRSSYILPSPYYSRSYLNYCDVMEPFLLEAYANNYYKPSNLKEFEEGDIAKQSGWREYVDHRNTSGWIINDRADPLQRDLSFLIQHEFPKFETWIGLIAVMYLKSYEGMGAATLYICGWETNHWLDGMMFHVDQTEKISIPYLTSIKLNAKHAAMCNKLPAEKRTVMIRYQPDYRTSIEEDRRHKKLKILSVQICSKANDETTQRNE